MRKHANAADGLETPGRICGAVVDPDPIFDKPEVNCWIRSNLTWWCDSFAEFSRDYSVWVSHRF